MKIPSVMTKIFAKLLTMMDVNLTTDAPGASLELSHQLANLLKLQKLSLHLSSIVTILMNKREKNSFQEVIMVKESTKAKMVETTMVKAIETITEKDLETTRWEDITAIMVLLKRDVA